MTVALPTGVFSQVLDYVQKHCTVVGGVEHDEILPRICNFLRACTRRNHLVRNLIDLQS